MCLSQLFNIGPGEGLTVCVHPVHRDFHPDWRTQTGPKYQNWHRLIQLWYENTPKTGFPLLFAGPGVGFCSDGNHTTLSRLPSLRII